MSASFLFDSAGLRCHRILRGSQEQSAEYRNEISPLDLELVLRDVPGKSVERRRYPQRLDVASGGCALLDTPRDEVVSVGRAPRRLRRCSPPTLTLAIAAATLPFTEARIRTKPSTTIPTRSLASHSSMLDSTSRRMPCFPY
jgi:hypothetical protein